MKKNILLCLILCNLSYSAPFETLNKNYNRIKSRVMVREIKIPTLANLDYARTRQTRSGTIRNPCRPRRLLKNRALGIAILIARSPINAIIFPKLP